MCRIVKSVPMVALRGLTVLPEMVVHFDVSREKSIAAVNEAVLEEGQEIFLSAQKDIEIDDPGMEDVYEVGVLACVKQVIKLPKNIQRVLVSGEKRAKLENLEFEEPYLRANITILEDEMMDLEALGDNADISLEAMMRGLKDIYAEYAMKNPKYPKEMIKQINGYTDFKKVVDSVAANIPLEYQELQEILEERDVFRRFELLSFKLVNEIQISNVKQEIEMKVKERMDENQREYILREQLKYIREELGEDSAVSDAEEFEKAVEKLQASEEIKQKINKEINRFRNSLNNPVESGVSRTYIETMLEMPWDKVCEENEDIKFAKEVLEEDHYGLEKVKERVLEFLAVRTLTKKGESPILCLVGPPGTGKTSIARSLARALNKPYVRICLGGVRDEAEIRGHRKTYVGAMPGRIANALKTAGVKNPLMLLDEIDKVSTDYKGDTFSALLEVLDSEQNNHFRDHYLEVPMDLSEVLFITTANSLQTIPTPLLDRMEVIEVNSYTENEKIHIAERHLIPKQLEKHGLTNEQVTISKGAL